MENKSIREIVEDWKRSGFTKFNSLTDELEQREKEKVEKLKIELMGTEHYYLISEKIDSVFAEDEVRGKGK